MTEDRPIRTKKNRTKRSDRSHSKDSTIPLSKTYRQKKVTRGKGISSSSCDDSLQTSSSGSDSELEIDVTLVDEHITCPHCDGKLRIDVPKKEIILYARHKTDEERMEANNASKRRWAEKNKAYLNNAAKNRMRRLREERRLKNV